MMRNLPLLLLLLLWMAPFTLPAQNESPEWPVEEYDTGEWDDDVQSGADHSAAYQQEALRRRELDREAWRKATEGLDYSRDKKRQKSDRNGNDGEDAGGGKKMQESPFSPRLNTELGIGIMKVLVILIAAVALFFLIRSLLGLKGPRNRKLKTGDLLGLSLEQIEERFQELELDDYIRQAIARGDYPLAIRLYYLAALKELSARERIHWKKDKTNLDYLREMRGTALLPAFQEVTYIFEWVWYGQRSIGAADFEKLEPKMKGFVERCRGAADA